MVLFLGFFIGLGYAFYVNLTYKEISDPNKIKNLKLARVIQLSKKSAVLEYEEKQKKYRLRVFDDVAGLKLSKGSDVIFSCDWVFPKKEDTFSLTQKLQKISQSCRGSIQKEDKYLYSPFELFRHSVREWLTLRLSRFHKDSLAEGFILADTSGIRPVELHFFRKMGIAHLFSASGLHLGLLFAIWYLPFLWLSRPRYGEILGLIFCTFFLVLLDFPTSLLRAYLFLLIYLILKFFDRKTSAFYIFFFVACFSEYIFPLSVFSYSFILSFGITGSILLTFPFFRKILPIKWIYLRDHLALTLAAFSGSLFLSPLLFGYINILSVVYNFLLVPLSGVYLLLVLISIVFLPVSNVVYFLDEIFHFSAFTHQIVWERFFTSVNSGLINVWLSLALILTLLSIFFMISKKQWYVRKWFFQAISFLIMIYFIQFFFIKNTTSGFKAFPYGVLLYDGKNLYLLGKLAPFIKEGYERFFRRPEVSIKKIYASSDLKSYSQELIALPLEEVRTIEFEQGWNLIKYKKKCFVFMSRWFNFQKAYQNTRACSSIYLINSKKYLKRLKKTSELFRRQRNDARIFISTFNRWSWYGK